MTLKKTNNESGVIMMETLIMLPVYLVILAGVFWLGEMCLIRQTLNTAERLRLWESGNRQSIFSEIANSDIFSVFIEDPNKSLPSTAAKQQQFVTGIGRMIKGNKKNSSNDFFTKQTENTANSWGTIKQGFVKINTRRSRWSFGIVDFARNILWSVLGQQTEQSKVASGRDEMSVISRGNDNAEALESIILFRTDKDYRTNLQNKKFEGIAWNNVYHERWDDFIKPESQGDITGITEYGARNEDYVRWSE